MDAFILISFITGGIIIALVVNIITQHNKIKRFAERLRRNFGQIERKEYDPEKAASYRGYYLNHLDDDGFYIDDITWNDAEGETLYNSINKCYSSCGDEYLYYTLRCIDTNPSKEKIDKYASQTDAIIEDTELRVKLQLLFAKLGKTGKHSVFEYISLLSDVKRVPLILFYIVWLVYILIIGSFFINVTLGICLLIAWMIVCVFIYISHNKLVQNYITSFEYIVRTLIISEKAVAMKIPFYEEEYERLTELRKKLKGVKTSYLSFIKQSNRTGIADLASGMTAIINCFFLIDIFFFYKMLKYVIDNEDAYGEIFAILGKMESQISVI